MKNYINELSSDNELADAGSPLNRWFFISRTTTLKINNSKQAVLEISLADIVGLDGLMFVEHKKHH